MATELNPYITFDGTAREAMTFYGRVFDAEPTMTTFGHYDENGESPNPDGIMHADLTTANGLRIMASDQAPGMPAPTGASISISISGDDTAELTGYWDQLADGATIHVPLQKQMWGDVFGTLTDRYGVDWMINIAGS